MKFKLSFARNIESIVFCQDGWRFESHTACHFFFNSFPPASLHFLLPFFLSLLPFLSPFSFSLIGRKEKIYIRRIEKKKKAPYNFLLVLFTP